jgi:hypothetical protein
MILQDRSFRKELDHENRALMNGISVLIKEDPENFPPPSTMGGHTDVTFYEPGNRPLSTLNLSAP